MSEILGHRIGDQELLEGEISERRNPADEREIVSQYHLGTKKIIDAAVESARDAFPAWSQTTRRDRAEAIFRTAGLLDTPEQTEILAKAMVDEIGKTMAGARAEVGKTVRILRHMAGLGTHTPDHVIHADQRGVHMYTATEPVGAAGIVTPFNFPVAVPAWKIAPALIAGCTVVLKPSPAAPETSRLLVDLFREGIDSVPALKEAKIKPGVLNMVYGGVDTVEALVQHPDLKAVSATTSTEAGKNILRMAMNREPPLDPRHFVAEMGGQNALVLLKDGNIDQAVTAAIIGAFMGEGQRCTATSRFVIEEEVKDEFTEKLLKRMRGIKVGPGKNPASEMGPVVSKEALETILNAVEKSQRNGMKLLHGGKRLTDGNLQYGNFMEPTLLEGDAENKDHLALHEEIFGPVAGICFIKGLDEAIKVVNGVTHRHVASIFTGNISNAFRFAKEAKVGMLHINNPTLGGDAQAPFGGLGGDTSFGQREMGIHAMDPFLVDKTVDINYAAGLAQGR